MSRATTAGIALPRPMPSFAGDRRVRCGPDDDPTLFPKRHTNATLEAAQKLCGPCPLYWACLDYAVEHERHHGYYAGTTPAERRRMAA